MTTTTAQTEILALLEEHAAAHAASDPQRVFALYTEGAVSYTLAPPLQQGPDTRYGTADGLRAWFATFDGPVRIDYRDPEVTVDGDVGYIHMLTKMTATPAGSPEPFSFWFRSTYGVRRRNGRWLFAHRHDSTPFYMDGSFRAAVDLQPDSRD